MSALLIKASAQRQVGFEQFYYAPNDRGAILVSKVFYENNKNIYTEARYNYEEPGTFSLIAGKKFSQKKALEYTVTPFAGAAIGEFKGFIAGLKTEVGFKKIYFSSESQYSFSFKDNNNSFFYSWLEAGCRAGSHLYAGVAMQLNVAAGTGAQAEPGVCVTFLVKKWTFPVYAFRAVNGNIYTVVGLNYELSLLKNKPVSKK